MSCIKCGHVGHISPVYTKDSFGRERLKYRCANCGYTWSTPTCDADDDEPNPFAGLPSRLHPRTVKRF